MGITVRGQMIVANIEMAVEECCSCGVLFAMTSDYKKEKLRYRHSDNRKWFYCPNGHRQFYTGETEEQKLKRELAQAKKDKDWYENHYRSARQEADHERRRAAGYKGHAARISKRVKAGVCPCCNRSFANLHQHMANQHPNFAAPELEESHG